MLSVMRLIAPAMARCGVVLGAAAFVAHGSTIWTRALPEAEGIQSVAADAGHVYVAYADEPVGHVAALRVGDGRLAWRAPSVPKASFVTASRGYVWAASDLTSQLASLSARTGHVVRQFTAPGGGTWDSLTSSGGVAYATSRVGPPDSPPYLSTITGRTISSVQITVPEPSLCTDVAPAGTLVILECRVGSPAINVLLRVDPLTGGESEMRTLPADTEPSLVAYHGAIYATTLVKGRYRIERYNSATFDLLRVSPKLDLAQGIASSPAGVFAAVNDHGVRIDRINPVTLTPIGSVAVPSGRYDAFLTANSRGIFPVFDRGDPGVQTLARLRFPSTLGPP